MRAPLSPPRATSNFVEKCPYTSGGRNAGVSGKRGLLYFFEFFLRYLVNTLYLYRQDKEKILKFDFW